MTNWARLCSRSGPVLTAAFIAAAGATAVGCEGTIGGPNGGQGSPSGGTTTVGAGTTGTASGTSTGGSVTGTGATTGGMPEACAGGVSPGRTPLRRLTRIEYDNTVRDLLNDTSNVSSTFPPEEEAHGFLNNADVYTTSDLHIEKYLNGAESLAAKARTAGQFNLPCKATATETCAKDFIKSFGLRAFRRPLEDAEVTSYYARFQVGAMGSFEEGLEWVVGRMLQSPHFLYRVEAAEGAAGAPHPLSPYALATRMSYFLWQTMPDAKLFDAASKGTLATKAGVEAEVLRMVQDAKFADTLSSFHDQWLHLAQIVGTPKANPSTPVWDAKLQADLLYEADLFIKDIFDNGGTLTTLLTGQHSFINAPLAQFYGAQVPAGTTAFVRVEKVPNRFGLLTMPAVLAVEAHPDQSAPVKRGKLIREQLLCTPPPDPPNNLVITVPAVKPGITTRERFQMHRTEASCAGCHSIMDPLGMPLEYYDEFGKYRTTDQGKPVDGKGDLTNTSAADTAVNNPEELGRKLAALPELQDCVVFQWFRFAAGHTEEKADTCMLNELTTRFHGSGQNMRDLLVAIATSDGFRYRVDN